MYSYIIAHTKTGIVRSEVAPSEQFTPEQVQDFLQKLDAVDGYQVREIEPVIPSETVIRFPDGAPF